MGWNPWTDIDREDITVFTDEVLPAATGGAVYIRYGDGSGIIVLDRRLYGPSRVTALAHEVVHHQRGGGCSHRSMPGAWSAVAAREERTVDLEVARRLVPPADLEEFIQGMCDIGLGVGPAEVVEQFDVCLQVAEAALQALKNGHRRYVA